jgi:two-component sensor histidine kinase
LEQLYLRYPDKTKHLVEKLTPIDELYAQAKMYNEAINWLNKLRDKKLYLDKSKPEAYTEQLITVANYAYLNNQLDTAMELYNKAYAIVESAAFENRDFLLGKIQGKQALVYLSQQEYEATIPLFKAEFLELLRKKDSVACARNLNNLAIAEKETKDYENALRHLQYIKTLVSIEEHPDILHQQLKLTSAVYGELKQYDSAFFYGSRYTALTDSLQISQAEKNASLVQLSNRLEQKEMMLENALLQEYKQRKLSSEILLTRNVAFAGVVLITLILIYVLYNLIKRNQQKHQLEKLIVDFENKAFQLQESLTQKETLIKEVHHRVKNNLQIVSGILQLQAMHVKGDQIKDFIKKSQNRIHSMSLIHQLLYQNQNLNKISIKEYINKLVMQLFMQYHVNPNRIQTNYYVPDIDINVDDAINIGLILNELITNVICHAYPDEEKGHLDIWLKHVKDNTYKLIIADDGPGLTGAIDEVENVGLKLAGLLVNQIKSKLHYTYNNGAEFHFTFNLKK